MEKLTPKQRQTINRVVAVLKGSDLSLTVNDIVNLSGLSQTVVKNTLDKIENVEQDEHGYYLPKEGESEPLPTSEPETPKAVEPDEVKQPSFKVGDIVYYNLNKKIQVVSQIINNDYFRLRELNPSNNSDAGSFYEARHKYMCHATQENYERLSATFPHIEFEKPPITGDYLVIAMLKKGFKNVLCLNATGKKVVIDRLNEGGCPCNDSIFAIGKLTPIDWQTNEPLTEAVLQNA